MKRFWVSILLATSIFSLTGCSNKALEEAKVVVNDYNTEVAIYNDQIAPYNGVVDEITEKNEQLEKTVDVAQDVLNKGETPFDENTTTVLKEAMTAALDKKVAIPDKLNVYEKVVLDEKAKKAELEEITAKANADTEAMKSFTLPETPTVPDYGEVTKALDDAKLAYEDSVQGLKQITAPSDDFVMERLKRVESITAMDAVTDEHDPNGKLNKQGGYIGCVYFTDTQVDRSQLYIEAGKDNVIDVGCEGGGALEIYRTVEEAQARDAYLGGFDGTAFTSGSHYIYGTVLVRTSDVLSGTKQQELTEKIVQALIYVEH